ncbi:hypothetical protein DXG01_010289 [Tephrocybe rancida]|nr:hypothetical protein DXG01_010289 [Tephrocybe rancida]
MPTDPDIDLLFQPLSSGSGLSPKARRKIPNNDKNPSRPNIRTTPSNLFTFTPSKPTGTPSSSSAAIHELQLVSIWEQFTTHQPDHRRTTTRQLSIPPEQQAPNLIPTLTLTTESSGGQTVPVAIPAFGPTFIDILTANKRRNVHAPIMVSMLNPLREKVPSTAWKHLACIEQKKRSPINPAMFSLPSKRFKRALHNIRPRSRSECESASCGQRCRYCERQTLLTELLVYRHETLRARRHSLTPQAEEANKVALYQTSTGIGDPLDSPRLHDLDDFDMDVDDAFPATDGFLDDLIDVDMSDGSLF